MGAVHAVDAAVLIGELPLFISVELQIKVTAVYNFDLFINEIKAKLLPNLNAGWECVFEPKCPTALFQILPRFTEAFPKLQERQIVR